MKLPTVLVSDKMLRGYVSCIVDLVLNPLGQLLLRRLRRQSIARMIGDEAQWGEGSHVDRLERTIACAHQADKLERQLARECEKRQKAELNVNRLQSVIETLADGDKTKTTAISGALFLMTN